MDTYRINGLKMSRLSICFCLCLILSCTGHGLNRVDFLIGTWKIENQNQYETWKKVGKDELIGYSYKISANQKIILETIAIKMIDNQMIYEATVPDQNEGQPVRFVLNTEIKSLYSFENPNHDFPKKIQYEKMSENEIMIRVSGDAGKGFSYKMMKQAVRK